MYGCIIGKDTDGVWLIADGQYDELQKNLDIFKGLNEETDIRLFSINASEMNEIRNDATLIKERFEGKF